MNEDDVQQAEPQQLPAMVRAGVAPEIQLPFAPPPAPVEDVVPEHVYKEAQIVSDAASTTIGSDALGRTVTSPTTIEQLIEDTRSNEIAVRKRALTLLSTRTDVPMEMRIIAGQGMVDVMKMEIDLPYAISRNAEEYLATADEEDEVRVPLVDSRASTEGRQVDAAYTAASSPEDVLAINALAEKGMAKEALSYVYATQQERAKLLSLDTASMLVVPFEPQRGLEMLRYLNNPKINSYLDRVGRLGGQAGYGTVLDEAGKLLMNESPQEQLRVGRAILDYTKKKNPMGGSGNTWIELTVTEALLRPILEGKEGREGWSKVVPILNNMNGIVDAYVVTKWLGGAVKIGGRIISDALGLATRVAPKSASSQIAKYLNLTKEELAAMGIKDGHELLNIAMPTHQAVLRNPNVSAELAEAVKKTMLGQISTHKQLINALEVKPTNFSETQLTSGMTSFLNRKGLVPQTSLSTIAAKGDDIEVTGRFGSAQGHGFATEQAASSALVKSLGNTNAGTLAVRHIPSGVVVAKGDPAYNAFAQKAAAKKTSGEYDWFVDVNTTTKYEDIYNIDDWVDATVIGHDTGKVARFLFDFTLTKSTDRLWDNSVTSAMMFHAGNKRHVQDMFQNLVKPELSKLSQKERAILNKALFENAGKPNLFTQPELAGFGLTSVRGQNAYYAVRGAMDILHSVADRGLSRSLRSEGFKILNDTAGTRIGFAKEISMGEIAIKDTAAVRLIDDAGARPVRMSVADLDKFAKQGGTFYKMKFAEWVGDTEVAYTVVSKSQLPKVLQSIPTHGVLPRAAGYFPEITKAPLSVFGISKSGRKYLIATAETTKDAEAYIAKAALDPDMQKRYEQFGHEYFSGYKDAVANAGREHEIYENLQGVVYGHKSSNDIINASGVGADYNKLDPLSAMNSVFTMLANNYTKGSYIQYMESQVTKFAKQYGLMTEDAIRAGRKVTSRVDLIAGTKKSGEQARLLKQAEQWIDTIDAYRLTPDAVEELTASLWKKAAAITSKSLPSFERYFLKNAQEAGDILAKVNSVFHFTNIVTHPIRQFMMNSAQALTNLAHPMAFTKAFFKHKTGFTTALFLKRDSSAGILKASDVSKAMDKIAKDMGVTRKELDGLVDSYLQGGLWNQVSHNTIARATSISEAEAAVLKDINRTVDPNLAQEAAAWTGNAFSKTRDVMNQAGFALGEHENAMYTFLTMFNATRKEKAFDVTTEAGRKALAGKTMAWIGNMTPEGRTGFQKGWWKTMFQYTAFQYKMLMNVMPEALGGSKLLTAPEKAKIVLSQVLLFGTDAVFVGGKARKSFEKYFIYDKELSPDEMIRRKQLYEESKTFFDFQYGLGTRYGNTMAQAVNNNMRNPEDWDTSPDILNFGEFLGVGSGTELIKERAIALGDAVAQVSSGSFSDMWKNALVIIGGTNGKKLNDWWQYANQSATMLANIPHQWTAEQKMEMYKFIANGTFSRAFSVVDKYQKLRAEQHFNEEMANTGITYKPYQDSLRSSISTSLGITWATEEEYYENRNKAVSTVEDKLEGPTKERKQMINNNARNLYKYILEQARTIPEDANEDFVTNVQLSVQKNMEVLRNALPDKDYYETVEALKVLMQNDIEAKNSNAAWIDRLHGTVVGSEYGEEGLDQVIKIWQLEVARVHPELGAAIETWLKNNEDMQFIFEEEEK